MTASPLASRLRRLERNTNQKDGVRRVFAFRPCAEDGTPIPDPVLDALDGREMTTAEWLAWVRAKNGLPPEAGPEDG